MVVLTDTQGAVLGPWVEACRPHAKVPPSDLRRTVEAILWRCRNGAKGRSIPAELGPWWKAAQIFIRRARLGVWDRLLDMARERGVELGMAFLDGTSIRAHAKAAGASKRGAGRGRGQGEALGRSRGGCGAKAVVVADRAGRAVAFRVAPGQAHELPHAVPLLAQLLPGVPRWVVADRGFGSHAFRDHVWRTGARPAIPPKRNEAPVACPARAYANRNRVERLWGRLQEWRAVATRYEKTARSLMGVL